MATAFVFWLIILVVSTSVATAGFIMKWYINNFTKRVTNEKYDAMLGGVSLVMAFSWMMLFMYVVG